MIEEVKPSNEQRLFEILGPDRAAMIERYIQLIEEWNTKFNLVSRRNNREDIRALVLDSLGLYPHLPGSDAASEQEIYDIGSGAGLPGVPLAIAGGLPHLGLVEVSQKRVTFLEHIKRELGLEINIHRLDARQLRPVSSTPILIAKAVASCSKMVEIFQHLIRGAYQPRFILLKGPAHQEELHELRRHYKFELQIAENQYKKGSVIVQISKIKKL